jgi:fatty-acid desaturase
MNDFVSHTIERSPNLDSHVHGSKWPWWRATRHDAMVLPWFILIHTTAFVGLILFPLPGWRVLTEALALAWIGGIGTTVCYHRALSHRALQLNRVAEAILIFFAMFNGSGSPLNWVANHRLHHAEADTSADISSPVLHGFWWAHLRWLWQAEPPSIERYCPDLQGSAYRWGVRAQPAVLALSFFSGAWLGLAAFFWLGAMRLVFVLHAQCFVNSICHTQPGISVGDDSSRNISWLAMMQLFLGENWHRNHHARPGLAHLGWRWWQLDVGYVMIRGLELTGLVSEVRRSRSLAA